MRRIFDMSISPATLSLGLGEEKSFLGEERRGGRSGGTSGGRARVC
jgi:hypothetical protein